MGYAKRSWQIVAESAVKGIHYHVKQSRTLPPKTFSAAKVYYKCFSFSPTASLPPSFISQDFSCHLPGFSSHSWMLGCACVYRLYYVAGCSQCISVKQTWCEIIDTHNSRSFISVFAFITPHPCCPMPFCAASHWLRMSLQNLTVSTILLGCYVRHAGSIHRGAERAELFGKVDYVVR